MPVGLVSSARLGRCDPGLSGPPTYHGPMTTVLLIRHGLTALTGSTLIGWTPGIHLDERGRVQAQATAARIRAVGLEVIVSSPLERCRETAEAVQADRRPGTPLEVDDRFGEVRYGDWTGGELKRLARDPLWKVIQTHPSSVTFPGGEALRDVQARAVGAIRDWNARLGPDATYAVVSHADVIKLILADALGVHLDGFQRINVGPASLSVVRYGELRASVVRMNDSGDAIDDLLPTRRRTRTSRPRPSGGGGLGGGSGGGASAPGRTSPSAEMSYDRPMPRRIYTFDDPDRFVAGTVGEPGNRTFFLQARRGGDVVSVALEKAQVAVLAQQLDALLDLLVDRGLAAIPGPGPSAARPEAADSEPGASRDDAPLGEPLVEAFRVGTMALTWDGASEQVIIQAAAIPEDGETSPNDTDDDDPDGPDLVRIRVSGAMARAFVARAGRVVLAGRPRCPKCGEPLDPQGHLCARPDTTYLN